MVAFATFASLRAAHKAACLTGASPVLEIGYLPGSNIRRFLGATPRDASSEVNALADEGQTNPSGRSIKRTLQPRYAVHLRIGDGGIVDAEPMQRWRRLPRAVKQ